MTTPCQIPRFFGVAAIAKRLEISTKTVGRWIASKDLHAHRLGRSIRVSEEDLAAFLSKHRR